MNAALGFLWHLWIDDPRRWHPLLSVYYLTYACDFRCRHCSDGTGTPYYQLRSATLSASRVLDLLAIIRRHCAYVVLTGGEPLQHPGLVEVLRGLPALRFRKVILTTNGFALGPVLPHVAGAVDELVISLQTLDPARADAWYGRGQPTLDTVLQNLQRAAAWPGRRFDIILSTVVTPGNIDDLYGVCSFAREHDFRIAACPQLMGVKAHPALTDDPAYRELYDFLIAEKRRGTRIHGTVDYLEYLRDLRPFRCRPFTMLVVSPTGDVFYPCLELGQPAGNLFEEPDLHRLRRKGLARYGPQPACDTRCHSACALGFARLLANPASLLHEAGVWARGRLVNRSAVSRRRRETRTTPR